MKPISHGFGFSVLADILNSGIYIFCDVAGGTISAYFGSTDLNSSPLAAGSLPAEIGLGEWHHVSASVDITDIVIRVDTCLY